MNNNIKFHFVSFLFVLAAVVLLTGCDGNTSTTENIIPTYGNMLTVAPTIGPTIKLPARVITTATPRPLTPTRTSTILNTLKPTPTWTMIPTYPSDEALRVIMEYYENNGSCRLPCWWGIYPGQTSLQVAREKLSVLGQEYGPYVSTTGDIKYVYKFDVPKVIAIHEDFQSFEPALWVDNGIVSVIALNSGYIERNFDTSLAGLLEYFGRPEEIWLKLVTDTQSMPHYELDLFYPKKGILINSTGDAQSKDNILFLCPEDFRRGVFPPSITLFSSSNNLSYRKLAQLIGLTTIDDYHLLSDSSSNYDEEDFFNDYIDPMAQSCINIDLDKSP